MKSSFVKLLIVTLITMTVSCNKKMMQSTDAVKSLAPINIQFQNMANELPITLNTGKYTNASGESFSISLLQYFVSNIELISADGKVYTVPQDSSYFLIKQANPQTQTIQLNVPEGRYAKIKFVLGIDSVRNTKPLSKRTGVLDPSSYEGAENMYWSWNSGYIFFKMEGNKITENPSVAGKKFRYHIGLFGGMDKPTLNNIKIIELDLTKKGLAKVRWGSQPTIVCTADVAKMFTGNSTITIDQFGTVMGGPTSALIANNYHQMFKHKTTIN